MSHTKEELLMIADALQDLWHERMKNSSNERLKEMCRCLKEDYKQAAANKR
jgi:hypothetical protein